MEESEVLNDYKLSLGFIKSLTGKLNKANEEMEILKNQINNSTFPQ